MKYKGRPSGDVRALLMMAMKLSGTLFLFLSFVLAAMSQTQQISDKQPEDRAVATWEPSFGLDNELYPSFVLATSGRAVKVPPSRRNFYGDPLGLAVVSIRPKVSDAKAHIEIQIEGLTQVSTFDATLTEAGQQYVIAPLLRYDYPRLATIEQTIPATVIYSVRVNGIDLGQQTRPIRVRSVNDVPFEMVTQDGKQQDFSFLFGYVNESHPFVQRVLQEALHWHSVNNFIGYQGSPKDVQLQVFALWNVLQRRQIHYSNVTTASAAPPPGHVYVYSQAVRFIDQSIQSQQANCVDGSVLFASLLYKIGIDPVLVKKPGHMFVGYYLDAKHKQLEFLETTKLSAGREPTSRNIQFSPVLHPVQSSESWHQFVEAVQFATNVFNQEVAPALQQHRPQYRLIDIAKWRQAGVNSIPRPW